VDEEKGKIEIETESLFEQQDDEESTDPTKPNRDEL
jgi:hypothetical protein